MTRRKQQPGIDHDSFGVTDIAEILTEQWAELPRPLLPHLRKTFPGLPLVVLVAALREASRRSS